VVVGANLLGAAIFLAAGRRRRSPASRRGQDVIT
jgi:hypothetical protein